MDDKLSLSLDEISAQSAPAKGKGGRGGAMRKQGGGRGARSAAAPYQRSARGGKGGGGGGGGGMSLSEMTQSKNVPPAAGAAAPAFVLTTGTTLRVGNLDLQVTTEDISELFGELGALKSAAVQTKPDGKSKGFALVTYRRKADAETALDKYNGVPLDGKPLKITLQSNLTPGGAAGGGGGGGGAAAIQIVAGGRGDRVITMPGAGRGGGGKGGRGRGGKGAAAFGDDDDDDAGGGGGKGKGGKGKGKGGGGKGGKGGKGGGKGGKGKGAGGGHATMEDLDAELDAYKASQTE